MRQLSGTVALVPTMGALHAGHLALIDEAKRRADNVVATIFVNPTQFNDKGDLERYPRREAEDAGLLAERGCDLLWMPAVEDIYPPGFSTTVHVSGVSERWEGEARPGHFDGVATVVAKLLLAVRPDVAVFGEKDFQQLAVIRRMVADLDLGVEIVGVPTVRDAGRPGAVIAQRLSVGRRAGARCRPSRALEAARDAILGGDRGRRSAQAGEADRWSTQGFSRVDYFALVDAATLEPLEAPQGAMRLIAAAVIGTDAADRQHRRLKWTNLNRLNRVNHFFAIRGLNCPQQGRGGRYGSDQSEERGIPDPEPARGRRSRQCRCVVRAWGDLFDRPRRRSGRPHRSP